MFSWICQGNKHLSDLDISKLNSAYGCPRRQSRGRGKGDSCNRHLAGAEGGRVRLDGARDDGCRVLVTVPEGSAVVLQFQVVPFLDSVMVRRCFGSKNAHYIGAAFENQCACFVQLWYCKPTSAKATTEECRTIKA